MIVKKVRFFYLVCAHSIARFQKRSLSGQVPQCKNHGRISMVAGGGVLIVVDRCFFSLCLVVIQTSFACCANEY